MHKLSQCNDNLKGIEMALNIKNLIKQYELIASSHTGEQLSQTVSKDLGEFYVKVLTVSGSKTDAEASVGFMRDEKVIFTMPVKMSVDVSEQSPNFIKQVYLHLKTLPEFADATDV